MDGDEDGVARWVVVAYNSDVDEVQFYAIDAEGAEEAREVVSALSSDIIHVTAWRGPDFRALARGLVKGPPDNLDPPEPEGVSLRRGFRRAIEALQRGETPVAFTGTVEVVEGTVGGWPDLGVDEVGTGAMDGWPVIEGLPPDAGEES